MNRKILALLLSVLVLAVGVHAQQVNLSQPKAIKERMLKVAGWQLANPKHKLFDWTNGAFYAGVFAAYETTKSQELMKAIWIWVSKINGSPGRDLTMRTTLPSARHISIFIGSRKIQK